MPEAAVTTIATARVRSGRAHATPTRRRSSRPVREVGTPTLRRRRLHQVRRRRAQRALDAAIERDLAAADGVDDDARRVGRIPDLELQLDVDRLITEAA